MLLRGLIANVYIYGYRPDNDTVSKNTLPFYLVRMFFAVCGELWNVEKNRLICTSLNMSSLPDDQSKAYSGECLYILEINENATLVFSISFQHGLVHTNFAFIRQLYFTYSINRSFFVLTDCQIVLFKSTCSKTRYLTPCNVPHEWFVFLHRALLADLVD